MTVLLPSSVARANLPLLLAALAAAVVYALAHPRWRHLPVLAWLAYGDIRRRAVLWVLISVGALLAVLGMSLEMYHARDCPNSIIFQFEIDVLARWLYEFSWRHGVPYWVVFGNLLFVLRGQHRIPVGDTDSDIAILKSDFLARFGSVDNFTRVARLDAAMELQTQVHIVYLRERELIQIYSNQELVGAHADIWLYEPEGRDPVTGQPQFLVNQDRTIRAKKIPYAQIMPLREQDASFLGAGVSLPRNPEYLARAEYGKSFMQPLVTRLECMENVWNGYCFYKSPEGGKRFALLILTLSSALAVAVTVAVAPLRRILVTFPHKRKHSAADHETERFIDKDIV